MATQKRGLGRGLEALLGNNANNSLLTVKPTAPESPAATSTTTTASTTTTLAAATPTASPAATTAAVATTSAAPAAIASPAAIATPTTSPTATPTITASVVQQYAVAEGILCALPVNTLRRGKYQPRHVMAEESLEELANSIRKQGVIQPIVVRSLSQNNYEIIAGERRWRAAQIAGLKEIPAIIRNVPDEAAIAMALIENIQRENLNPLEEAAALHRLIAEFSMTHQQVADTVGRSRASVSNLLRLLDLNATVKIHVEKGELEMGHARALLALTSAQQPQAALIIIARSLSVRETEQLVKRWQETGNPDNAHTSATQKLNSKPLSPDVRRLQMDLSEILCARVTIKHQEKGKGRGKLIIQYNSLAELDGILEHIKKEPATIE